MQREGLNTLALIRAVVRDDRFLPVSPDFRALEPMGISQMRTPPSSTFCTQSPGLQALGSPACRKQGLAVGRDCHLVALNSVRGCRIEKPCFASQKRLYFMD